MKSTLLLLLIAALAFGEQEKEKIPSMQKALKLKAKQNEVQTPFPSSSFDPSFLLDVDDDFSFKDPLTDPIAAKEKEEHPELSTQVSPEVMGIAPPEHIYNPLQPMPAVPSTASKTPLVLAPGKNGPAPYYGPETMDRQPSNANAQAQSNSNTVSTMYSPQAAQVPPLGPVMAGVNPFGAATEKTAPPPSTPAQPMMGVSDVAVVLSNNQFFPSRIRLREGMPTRLIFATLNKKSAALIIEKLQVQRWMAKEDKTEINREIATSKVTEVQISPARGTYSFYDAISGASGEIIVE